MSASGCKQRSESAIAKSKNNFEKGQHQALQHPPKQQAAWEVDGCTEQEQMLMKVSTAILLEWEQVNTLSLGEAAHMIQMNMNKN
eukprot:354079-Pelagomonas_calceolata.AAC.1